MNKQGSVMIYGLMLALVLLILGLALAPAVKDFTTDARTNMDCDNESISNFDKAGCIATDMTLPYFIGTVIFIGGAIITAKIIFT